MTEAEWLAATDPKPMLGFLKGKVSDRKMRLLAVACCRRIWHLSEERQSRNQVEMAEAYAEGVIDLTSFINSSYEVPHPNTFLHKSKEEELATFAFQAAASLPCKDLQEATFTATSFTMDYALMAESYIQKDGKGQRHLIRDIFGNPFRPVALNHSLLTSTVVALANGIYSEKAFDRMPILADALQDAGCDSEDILNHCRQPGEHVRGCWVVDLLLGK